MRSVTAQWFTSVLCYSAVVYERALLQRSGSRACSVTAQWFIESQNFPDHTVGFSNDGTNNFAAQIDEKGRR